MGLVLLSVLISASAAAASPGLPAVSAGKLVYMDFWASWCAPCAESFPWLNSMQAKYGDRISIVAIDVDSDPADGQAFLRTHPATFKISFDPQGQLAERYHIDGMPSTVIVDATGRVLHQHSGFYVDKAGDYEAAIEQAIKQSTKASAAPAGSVP